MIFVLMLACVVAGGVNGALQPIEPLSPFVTSFRQVLLEKIAVETNNTVEASEVLKTKIDNECKPKLEAAIANCKLCAQSKCQVTPTFTDIVKLANPYLYLKGPLDQMAGKMNIAYGLVGLKMAPFINSMKNLGKAIPGEIKNAFKKITDGLEKMYKTLRLADIGKGFIDLGKIYKDNFLSIGSSFRDLFKWRRRRSAAIDPKVRQCMEKCTPCLPLLEPTEAKIVAAVCGKEIAIQNATLVAQMLKIQTVFDHVVDTVKPIVTQLQGDMSTMNGFNFTDVVITYAIDGAYKTYTAGQQVPMLDMATPLALEYWKNFPLKVPA